MIVLAGILLFSIPQFIPEKSVAYQNDIKGFIGHQMEPLNLWMGFHMAFWFVWMLFPIFWDCLPKKRQCLK